MYSSDGTDVASQPNRSGNQKSILLASTTPLPTSSPDPRLSPPSVAVSRMPRGPTRPMTVNLRRRLLDARFNALAANLPRPLPPCSNLTNLVHVLPSRSTAVSVHQTGVPLSTPSSSTHRRHLPLPRLPLVVSSQRHCPDQIKILRARRRLTIRARSQSQSSRLNWVERRRRRWG